jgi:hypothetical protein
MARFATNSWNVQCVPDLSAGVKGGEIFNTGRRGQKSQVKMEKFLISTLANGI